jgi:hypothetical protein
MRLGYGRKSLHIGTGDLNGWTRLRRQCHCGVVQFLYSRPRPTFEGRLLMALVQFVLAFLLWFVLLGWAIHLWSILDAAMFKPKV